MFNVTDAIVPSLNVFLCSNCHSFWSTSCRRARSYSDQVEVYVRDLCGFKEPVIVHLLLFDCFALTCYFSIHLPCSLYGSIQICHLLFIKFLFSSFSLLFYAFFYCHLSTYRHTDDRVWASYCIRPVMCVSLTLTATLMWQSSPGYISLSWIKKSWAEKCHTSHLREITHTHTHTHTHLKGC